MRSLVAFFRLGRAGFVIAREGVFSGFDISLMPIETRLPMRFAQLIARKQKSSSRAARMSKALVKLGPSYIKLGQFLATRPDLVGQDIARDLEILQDRLPPFGLDEAHLLFERALGKNFKDVFEDIGEPVAAASIAQVHKAQLKSHAAKGMTSSYVAVKILRPDVRERFARDLKDFSKAAAFIEMIAPKVRRLRPSAIVQTFAKSVMMELDLRLEAAAYGEMAEKTALDDGFDVAKVHWEYTSRDTLITDWVEGFKLSDEKALDGLTLERPKLAAHLIQAFLRHAMRDGFFHADMHQGNLFVRPDGVLVAIDLGITGRLSRDEQRFLAEILFGFITRDYERISRVHFEAGYIPRDEDEQAFAQALRSVGEPIYGRHAEEISMGKLLTHLFEVTELFNMQTQTQLILLQKTMVVVEGVARKIDPQLDMWAVAEPIVRRAIKEHIGPKAMVFQAQETLKAVDLIAKKLPSFARFLDTDPWNKCDAQTDFLGQTIQTKQKNTYKKYAYSAFTFMCCVISFYFLIKIFGGLSS